VRRRPLEPLPYPVHRRTGEPQEPNGALVFARGPQASFGTATG
jgi:hypothetical protein